MALMPKWVPRFARGRLPQPVRSSVKTAYWRAQRLLPKPVPTGLEPSVMKALGVTQIRTIFDVGANVGQMAAMLSGLYPQAQVHSFKPVRATFLTLQSQTRALSNVHPHHLALGASMRQGSMSIGVDSQLSRLVEADACAAEVEGTEVVTIDTLDRFCRLHGLSGPDLVKCDTEGYDLQVLIGSRERLASGIRCVLVEVGMLADDSTHSGLAEIQDFLSNFQFALRGIYEPHYKHNGTLHFANALFVKDVMPDRG